MIPRYLTISGFLSYQAPVKIDFSDIRVACITGQNGAGKSAMLDAMTWALFGEARKNDESVINEAVDPQVANVVFDFSYESALYRIDRTMKKGRPKTVEFFIWSETTSEWRSLTEKTVGKTDKKICDVLHTNFRTFENVSFFLQGKADKFTSQNATSRKEILSDILGLEVWENYRVAASEKRQNVKNEISILESEISEAEKEIEEEAARREALAKVEKDLTEVGKRRELAAAQWESARRDELLLQTLQKSVDDLRSRESGVFSQLESEKKALAERETELAEQQKKTANSAKIEQDFNELIETREKLTQLNQQAAQYHQLETAKMKTKAAIENEKTRLEEERKALQREADDIQKKKSTLPGLEEKQKKQAEEILSSHAKLPNREQLTLTLTELTDRKSMLEAENKRLKAEMKQLDEQRTNLQTHSGGICPVCEAPLDAAHCDILIGGIVEKGTALKQIFLQNKTEGEDALVKIEAIKNETKKADAEEQNLHRLEKESVQLNTEVRLLQDEITKWEQERQQKLADIERKLNAADYCASEREKYKQIDAQIYAMQYNPEIFIGWQAKEKKLHSAEKEFQVLQKAKGAIEPLEREINGIKQRVGQLYSEWQKLTETVQTEASKLKQQQADMPNIKAVKTALDAAQSDEKQLSIAKGRAEQLVTVLDSLKIEVKENRIKLKESNLQFNRLKTLEKAFSKNGVPALLIDQALPEIEEQANRILENLSEENPMQVHFDTLRDYKDKSKTDKKETLDIWITDIFGTRDYSLYSGGEAFRINFAIRLALSRILSQRAGARLQLLVIDEGFGSQDAEGRSRLLEAISSVQSDFEMILVITHFDELKDAFPARIEVEKSKTGSKVEVIA